MPQSSDEQLQFLVNLQRLLDEGQFVASYKFALLLALADLAIEQGDESGGPLQLSTEAIAGKFIQYYWRQAVPYPSSSDARVHSTVASAKRMPRFSHSRTARTLERIPPPRARISM